MMKQNANQMRGVGERAVSLPDFRTKSGSASLGRNDKNIWLVTGGGYGITFEVMKELALKRKNSEDLFILLGRSTPNTSPEISKTAFFEEYRKENPKATIPECVKAFEKATAGWKLAKNLETLNDLGIAYRYVSLDILDQKSLSSLLNEIHKENPNASFSIIHGAGISIEKNLIDKDLNEWKRVFDTKVKGLLDLLSLFFAQSDRLKEIFLFGSIAGCSGGFGQTDYGAANSFLANFARSSRDIFPNTRFLCFDFPAWDGVGMSMRPHTRKFFAAQGMEYLPLEDGVRRTINLMLDQNQSGEVLIAQKL